MARPLSLVAQSGKAEHAVPNGISPLGINFVDVARRRYFHRAAAKG